MGLGYNVGAKAEILDRTLRVRAGAYTEVDRLDGDPMGRLHVTGGADIHVFDLLFWRFRITAAFDFAKGYRNLLLGFGTWS